MSCVSVPGYEPLTMSKDLPHYFLDLSSAYAGRIKKKFHPPLFEERVENVQPSLGRKYRIFQHLLAFCI